MTNTLIERKGARNRAGHHGRVPGTHWKFGREGRYDIYDLGLELPEPLVERRLRFGVPERMNVSGADVLKPLDEASILDACKVVSG